MADIGNAQGGAVDVPEDDQRMAKAPKPATSPCWRANDDLGANAADRACFLEARPVDRKNVCRRNDRTWGHCNSATCGPYYSATRINERNNS
jgi:hypothetical protein